MHFSIMNVLDGWGAKEHTRTVSLEVGDSCSLLQRFTLGFLLANTWFPFSYLHTSLAGLM